ncbi:MAG: ribokinase [Anaerolineales bacterium]
MTNHIVVVGSLNMDLVVRTQRHPQIGETVLGHNFQTYPGGKGANQAVAAARLGGNIKMIGRIGVDPFGDTLLEKVTSDGVDTLHILRDADAPTGVAFITVDDQGQNTIVVASGANGRLAPEDISNAEDVFNQASVLLLQLECPLAAVEHAIDIARKYDTKIVLNPAPAQLLDSDLLEQVDYLIPNQSELRLLAGQESVSTSIDVLIGMGVKSIVVTLGESGSIVVDGGQQKMVPAYKVPVVDTTAAGDAFAGAFALALCEGKSVLEAARWGNAAGALTVMRAGAQPSLPYREEFLSFLRNN